MRRADGVSYWYNLEQDVVDNDDAVF
jgi:hypothetical protein